MRGGIHIQFKVIGPRIILYTFIPSILEASIAAGFGIWLFEFNVAIAYSMGFIISAVAPGVLIPNLMIL